MKFDIVFTTSVFHLNRPSLDLTSLPGSLFSLSPRAEKHFALFGQSGGFALKLTKKRATKEI